MTEKIGYGLGLMETRAAAAIHSGEPAEPPIVRGPGVEVSKHARHWKHKARQALSLRWKPSKPVWHWKSSKPVGGPPEIGNATGGSLADTMPKHGFY
jgi:hypothetical protein